MTIADPGRGITLGRHLGKPGGMFDGLASDNVIKDFIDALQGHRGRGAWWAPGVFRDDYRKQEHWIGTWCVGIDGDFYANGAGHSTPPPAARSLAPSALMAETLYHDTPRGFRGIIVLDRFVSSADEYAKLARGVKVRIERGLEKAGILGRVAWGADAKGKKVRVVERDGFIVDEAALFDRAWLFFTPNATVEGEASPRRAEVQIVRGVQ